MADDTAPATAPGASNPAPISYTIGATMTAASLAPAIAWLLNGCPKPVPDAVSLTLGALLIIAAHGAQKLVAAWLARPAAPPAAPPVKPAV